MMRKKGGFVKINLKADSSAVIEEGNQIGKQKGEKRGKFGENRRFEKQNST